ncbi:MAG: ferrochelatase [Candidatus Limnocylindria bacterium]|jgi:ferrochelatase
MMGPIGVLLVNLGTPRSPRPGDVRRYLREFLGDPLVLDMPAPLRFLLLELVILPFRPRRSAQAYQKIWGPEGSPLLVNGRALAGALAAELGPGYAVELGMRYGAPAIREALGKLAARAPARLIALPLFPQYSTAATGSALEKLAREHARLGSLPALETLGAFYDRPEFSAAWNQIARERLASFRPDFVLFSYHGLPERQVAKLDRSGRHCFASADCCDAVGSANRDCYRAHCFATTRALAAELKLERERYTTSFQSRLGRTPWIKPYTDLLLPELAARGHRRLAVLCPAFVADCLETLEEIGIRARDQWRSLGGEELLLVPSLNAQPVWVRALAGWIQEASAASGARSEPQASEVHQS